MESTSFPKFVFVRKAALQSVHESEILPREKIIKALEEANLKKKTKMAANNPNADPEGAIQTFPPYVALR